MSYWSPSTTTEPKARKRHQCDACLGHIEPGERYEYTSGFYDGAPHTWKQCKICRPDEDFTYHRPEYAGQTMHGYLDGYPNDDRTDHVLVVWTSPDGKKWEVLDDDE